MVQDIGSSNYYGAEGGGWPDCRGGANYLIGEDMGCILARRGKREREPCAFSNMGKATTFFCFSSKKHIYCKICLKRFKYIHHYSWLYEL